MVTPSTEENVGGDAHDGTRGMVTPSTENRSLGTPLTQRLGRIFGDPQARKNPRVVRPCPVPGQGGGQDGKSVGGDRTDATLENDRW